MRNKYLFILTAIFLSALFLRFYNLGNIPSGFHRDEAFLGYNAYSILKTGNDINGNFFPLHLESFLYTPAGYSYFSIPFIFLFGLNEFSTRFASALFGALTVLAAYFLIIEIFKVHLKESKINIKLIAVFASLFLAISPWHINLSRTASTSTLVVFFITLGILTFFNWIKRQRDWLLFLSFIFFGISLFFYISPYSFLPLFLPFTFIIYKSYIITAKKVKIIILFLLLLIPVILTLKSPQLSLRAKSISIFNNETMSLSLNEQIREDGVNKNDPYFTRLFHNKLTNYSSIFLENYFKHFSYDFLFSAKGFPDRYRIPLSGLLYIFELPLVIFGLLFLIRTNKKLALFLTGWILIAPIGSSFAFDDVPNLQRTLFIFPALSIISAFGAYYLLDLTAKRSLFVKLFIAFLCLIVFYNFIYYLHQYYSHGSLYRPWYRQDGYKNLVEIVNKNILSYKKAVITNRESGPTIFFLFYTKYNPSLFQKETSNSLMKDFDRINFGKYEFSEEECPFREIQNNKEVEIIGERNILYVDSGLCKVPKTANVIDKIKRKDNSLVFYILSL